jgi:hypothetical protein
MGVAVAVTVGEAVGTGVSVAGSKVGLAVSVNKGSEISFVGVGGTAFWQAERLVKKNITKTTVKMVCAFGCIANSSADNI